MATKKIVAIARKILSFKVNIIEKIWLSKELSLKLKKLPAGNWWFFWEDHAVLEVPRLLICSPFFTP